MADVIEHFIKGSDNIVTLTLTEDGSALVAVPTSIDIVIGDVVTISRSPDGSGITYTDGVIEIVPRSLTEDLSGLVDGSIYRVYIVVKTVTETSGVVFGDADSGAKLYFKISSNPV